MARKVWRYTLSVSEQKLWDRDDMKGWCKALQGCVEDEAREEGLKKFVIYDREGEIILKDTVTVLPDPKTIETRRESTALY